MSFEKTYGRVYFQVSKKQKKIITILLNYNYYFNIPFKRWLENIWGIPWKAQKTKCDLNRAGM